MELLEYCLTSCPASQTEPIMAGLVRITSGTIKASKKYEVVESLITDMQLKIAEKCSEILDREESEKKV